MEGWEVAVNFLKLGLPHSLSHILQKRWERIHWLQTDLIYLVAVCQSVLVQRCELKATKDDSVVYLVFYDRLEKTLSGPDLNFWTASGSCLLFLPHWYLFSFSPSYNISNFLWEATPCPISNHVVWDGSIWPTFQLPKALNFLSCVDSFKGGLINWACPSIKIPSL